MSKAFEEVDLFGEIPRLSADSVLREKFIMPPFSVLSARDGEWQERKRKWLALGIRSEVGRGEVAKTTGGGSIMPACDCGSSGERTMGGASMTNASNSAMRLAGGFKPRHGLTDGK